MRTLEDRLDRTSGEVRNRIAQMPVRPASEVSRRLHQRRMITMTVAVIVVFGSFAGTALLLTGESGSSVASGPAAIEPANSDTDPASETPTTLGPSDAVYDTATATAWRSRVVAALSLSGLPNDVTSSYETRMPFRSGGSVTAVVEDTNGHRVLVVDLQGWAPGEYSTDPSWQQEAGGSNEPGTPIADGTLFIADSLPTIRSFVLVTEGGLLTVQAQKTSLVSLPETNAMVSFVESLAPAIGDIATVVSSDAEATAPLAALPRLGLDLPGWVATDATEEDGTEGGFRSINYYLPSEQGAPVVVVKLRIRGIPEGSAHEAGLWWMNRSDFTTVSVRGHDARMFASDGDFDFAWRESENAVVTLSVLSGLEVVTPDRATSIATSVINLNPEMWQELLLLAPSDSEIPSSPTTAIGDQ